MNIKAPGFDLALTMTCGQHFCYEQLAPSEFIVIDGPRTFWVRQSGDTLSFEGITGRGLRRYFDLNHDWSGLGFGKRPFAGALKEFSGVRLVRQDARQAIFSFILSSNNNTVRIKRMLDSLRERHGKEIVVKGRTVKAFPDRIGDLVGLKYGYRESFVKKTHDVLDDRFLERLKKQEYVTARELLQTLPGVGPKVADCILCYSELARTEAFPADVWVKRALKEHFPYFRRRPLTDKHVRAFSTRFKHPAYAQQLLFLGARADLSKEKKKKEKSTSGRSRT